jgi:hypothetical protein
MADCLNGAGYAGARVGGQSGSNVATQQSAPDLNNKETTRQNDNRSQRVLRGFLAVLIWDGV